MNAKRIFLSILLGMVSIGMEARDIPFIGAQVFIEPGQTDSDVSGWFRTMKDCGMKACRIRMFESYCHGKDGWDFSLFDRAFDYAHENGIGVFATIFPDMEGNGIGGFKFPVDAVHEKTVNAFTDALVAHFKDHPALKAWVLINEPGVEGVLPDEPFTNARFEEWKKSHPHKTFTPEGYPVLVHFDTERFLLEYNTDYLASIARRVRAIDPAHQIHVNNHQIFRNAAEYDFPAWREFLSSLGASAHPSWHFGYFPRERYNLAMAANCDIIRSGAGPIPWLITELQAGNNTYSAFNAFCPTPEELAQWMWTGIGEGAGGVIFWTLNPRGVGGEAGEWALLNMQGGVSARSEVARKTALAISSNADIFANAMPLESPVSILYARESLWAEKQVQLGDLTDSDYEGRHEGGVMKSAVAMYQALMEHGLKPQFGEMGEYDWTREDYSGKAVIISGQVCIPRHYYASLRSFVEKGGTLLVEGLSFFYDEYMSDVFGHGFPLSDVFGATLEEVFCSPGDQKIDVGGRKMWVHLWEGILNADGRKTRRADHAYGRGRVVWIPSMIGLGAVRKGAVKKLSAIIRDAIRVEEQPLSFSRYGKGLSLQVLCSGKTFVSVVSNSGHQGKVVRIKTGLRRGKTLFSQAPDGKRCRHFGKYVFLPAGATVVDCWE